MITVNDVKQKYTVNLDEIRSQELSILKATYDAGVAHLEYFRKTMSFFKNPELRLKCYDTLYYEQVIPTVISILKEKGVL